MTNTQFDYAIRGRFVCECGNSTNNKSGVCRTCTHSKQIEDGEPEW